MPRSPNVKTADKDSTGNFAWLQHFIHCIRRSLGEGGHLAPQTAPRVSAFLEREASPQVVSEAKDNGCIYDPACGSGGSLPASRLCGVRFAEKDHVIAQGVVQSQGQDKWARWQRPLGLATRARRVRQRGQQPKQSNATTRRLAICGIEADVGHEHADTFRRHHPVFLNDTPERIQTLHTTARERM